VLCCLQSRDQRRAAEEALRRQQQPPRFQQLMRQARVTGFAQELWQQVVQPGDCVVDATCGRGHDTAWLAKAVGPSGTVHAFDIQPDAIEATQQLVASSLPQGAAGPAVHYHQASHVEMLQRVGSGCARIISFNLGYLPGGDQQTTTTEGSTLAALQAACFVLQPGGLCTVLCYTGHPGGDPWPRRRLPPAACRLPPAACRLPPAACRLLMCSCLSQHARLPQLLTGAAASSAVCPVHLLVPFHSVVQAGLRSTRQYRSCLLSWRPRPG
jgi:SAM-dependent methyltransferase